MRKVLLFLILLVALPVIVVSADTSTDGVSLTVDESTQQTYSNYIYEYNRLKKIAEQYENNMAMDMSDTFTWYKTDDLEEADGVNSESNPLGVYDKNYIAERFDIDISTLQAKLDRGINVVSDDSANYLTSNEYAYALNCEFDYYYNYEDSTLLQLMWYSSEELGIENKLYYVVWGTEGTVYYSGKGE